MTGIELIRAERNRQETLPTLDGEGFDAKRDDKYVNGELAEAAACYIISAQDIFCKCRVCMERRIEANFEYEAPEAWPWDKEWWKPGNPPDRVRMLVKAGALIAAEIDRLQRVESVIYRLTRITI